MARSYQRPAGGSSFRRAGAATTASPLRRPTSSACSAASSSERTASTASGKTASPSDTVTRPTVGNSWPATALRMRWATTSASARSAPGKSTPKPCAPIRAAKS